jgi:site-specific recombinase XerD
MDQAMVLRGFSVRTREAYLRCVAQLARHYHCSPDQLDRAQIEAYLLHLIEQRKLAYASVNQANCAIRFLFGRVLGRESALFELPMARVPKRLPQVLSREDVARLLGAARSARARAVLMTTYAAGLRLSELCALQLTDVQSAPDRMCLKVCGGKGGRDRYTLLSARLLAELRAYWHQYRPRHWLFENGSGDGQIGQCTVQRMYGAARDAAGIAPAGGIHTLRHAFATHLIEAGVDVLTVQRLLGHGHIGSTLRYVHLARSRLTGTDSPLDLLEVTHHSDQ